MEVQSDSATIGEKELKSNWPIEEGIELGTTKQKIEPKQLIPETNLIPQREMVGLI